MKIRNQPKYHLVKNSMYAISGLKDILKTETSFKIEAALFVIFCLVIIFLPASLVQKSILFMSLVFVLIAETVNSAIERVVDLVTLEHHELAGRAKDVGSSIVFLSILTCVIIWLIMLFDIFLSN